MSPADAPAARAPAAAVAANVAAALAEDVADGDVSAALVEDREASASIICRERAILCGTAWADACFHSVDAGVRLHWLATDGDWLEAGEPVVQIVGPQRALLTAERSALNFLQLLSSTATQTAEYVAAVAGTRARVLDTRKTLPGLRLAQKYAVRCGGGDNHRLGLFDAVMLKENHLAAAGGVAAAMATARARFPTLPLIVEVETLAQLDEVITTGGATRVLLDNFDLRALTEAVSLAAGRVALEASGGLDIDSVAAVACSGVDCVSVGAITKHVRAIDFSMRFAATD